MKSDKIKFEDVEMKFIFMVKDFQIYLIIVKENQ